jgi:basic membrane protein A
MKKLLVLSALFTYACGISAAPPKKPVKIGLIVQDTVDDKGWCQSMYDALKAVQKAYGPSLVEVNVSEKMKPVDAGSAARQYASKHFDIIICHGAQYKNLVLDLAPEFPAISFAYGTNGEVGPKNVFTYMPESEQTGYLNGIIAGMVTKTNVVGLVGPSDSGDAARYDRGFWLGVKSVNPKADVKVAHTGSFSDFVKASELAQTEMKAGADFLTGSSQQALGALRAVAETKDKPVWWAGQDVAQLTIPNSFKVVAASSYDYVPVVEELIAKHEAGKLGGEVIPMTFGNKGFVYKFNDQVGPVLTKAIRDKVMKAKADIASGKLVVAYKDVKF